MSWRGLCASGAPRASRELFGGRGRLAASLTPVPDRFALSVEKDAYARQIKLRIKAAEKTDSGGAGVLRHSNFELRSSEIIPLGIRSGGISPPPYPSQLEGLLAPASMMGLGR